MSLTYIEWTDEPLTKDNNGLSVYLTEIQNNTNYLQQQVSLGISAWTNASAGEKFRKIHYVELMTAIENASLISYYGHNTISDILGRPWSALPRMIRDGNNIDIGGFALLNDMRIVLDIMAFDFTFSDISGTFCGSAISDQTSFTVSITATLGGVVLTDYNKACTITSDQQSESGNTIAVEDWVNGVATLSSMQVVFRGSPAEVVLTCNDDLTGLDSGNQSFLAETGIPDCLKINGYVDGDISLSDCSTCLNASALPIWDGTFNNISAICPNKSCFWIALDGVDATSWDIDGKQTHTHPNWPGCLGEPGFYGTPQIGFSDSFKWYFQIYCSTAGGNLLAYEAKKATPASLNTPLGTYTRTGGCATGPSAITIVECP